MKTKENVKTSMREMMESLFTYGGLHKDNNYLTEYRIKLSKDEFNKVFDEYSKYLRDNFRVIHGTYTDFEGCTYNSLEKI